MKPNCDEVILWRSLLQLAQATYAVLEREIPESEGLPERGLGVIRLLRWEGPKTVQAIATFLGMPARTARELVEDLRDCGMIRLSPASSDERDGSFELTAMGVEAARGIVAAQRKHVENAVRHVAPEHRHLASAIAEQLAYGLVADSTGFGITCAACWAIDPRECLKPGTKTHCPFRQAQRAELDPKLSLGEDEAPCYCGLRTAQIHQPDGGP